MFKKKDKTIGAFESHCDEMAQMIAKLANENAALMIENAMLKKRLVSAERGYDSALRCASEAAKVICLLAEDSAVRHE